MYKTCFAYCYFSNLVSEALPMIDWSCEQVEDWAKDVDIDASSIKAMRDNDIDGKQLHHCTEEDLGKIIRSKWRRLTIIEERDNYLITEASQQFIPAVSKDDVRIPKGTTKII